MTDFAIDFVQRIDPAGYEIIEGRIVRCGETDREARPLEFHRTLYAQFASLGDDNEDYLEFVCTFGPLTADGNFGGESVDLLRNMRSRLAEIIETAARDPAELTSASTWESAENMEARSRHEGQPVLVVQPGETLTLPSLFATEAPSDWLRLFSWAANLQGLLRPGPPDGRPTLYLTPKTLWDGLKIQLYQTIASGARIKACEWCGQWFEIGRGGKRAGARFCSDICRLHHHRNRNGDSK